MELVDRSELLKIMADNSELPEPNETVTLLASDLMQARLEKRLAQERPKKVWIVVGLGDIIAMVFDSEAKALTYVGKRTALYTIEEQEVK